MHNKMVQVEVGEERKRGGEEEDTIQHCRFFIIYCCTSFHEFRPITDYLLGKII